MQESEDKEKGWEMLSSGYDTANPLENVNTARVRASHLNNFIYIL